MTNSELHVDFCGEIHEVEPGNTLTFGRDADLVIDTNRHLHRRLGRFVHRSGQWIVENTGTAIPIDVIDLESASHMSVAPGSALPLAFGSCSLRFAAGASTYQIDIRTTIATVVDDWDDVDSGTLTIRANSIPLTHDQKICLVALAEKRLRDRTASPSDLPTNKAVAERLGWGLTKFNRKLDNLCDKFDRAGVANLRGGQDKLAKRRRERLVDHAITVGLITEDDLAMLD